MRKMTLKSTTNQTRLIRGKIWQESGQTLHEVLIASSILAISISGFASGIIRSNRITDQASLRKVAESVMANDLESIVKRRFYTFRCRQGPCRAATTENDESLMYYDKDDSDDKQDFVGLCNSRSLASELLSDNEDDVTTGEHIINDSSLTNQDITITRTISLDESNNNQAVIKYEAEKNNEVIATIKTTVVPNAVHWCS